MCRESRGTGATAAPTELHRRFFCVVDCEDCHLRTVKIMRAMAKARRAAFIYLSLLHLDRTGNAALEQWKHVA